MFNKISNKFGRIMVAAIGLAGVLLFALMFCASALYYASACKRGVYPLLLTLPLFVATSSTPCL